MIEAFKKKVFWFLLAHMSQSLSWVFFLLKSDRRPSVCRTILAFSSDHSMPSHQTNHKYSFRGDEEVLLLFRAIRKPIWLSWPLIGNTLLTSSPELQHEKSPDLAEIFLYRSSKKVATFQSDSKFKMATKASDWSRHFVLFSP
jgi:hypothetical protein